MKPVADEQLGLTIVGLTGVGKSEHVRACLAKLGAVPLLSWPQIRIVLYKEILLSYVQIGNVARVDFRVNRNWQRPAL